MSFDSFELDPVLLAGVSDLGFTEPTDIQRDAIPWALEGRDLLACAMTGSGKTAAFALPILQRIVGKDRGTTRALVLSPTRELALQIEQHFRDLAKHTPVKVASIFGGVGYEPQERAFREGADVLIATPGRLLDHLRRPYAKLDGLEVLVLDEADRMLDMGFIPDVRRILRHVPPERQTLFFSATLAKPIQRLAGDMLEEPVTINLERRSTPAEGVRQVVYPVRHELKPALLLHLLERHDVDTALVFTRTKQRADLTGTYLKRAGVRVAVIHGDRTQQHRTRVMNQFKEGKFQVLVATDVAARGIDVEELSHVINLDVPNQPDDYIHRVGRTARAGSTGDAMTFVAARELADLHLIEKAIGQKLERVRLDDFDYSKSAAAEAGRDGSSSGRGRGAASATAAPAASDDDGGGAAGAVASEPPSNVDADVDADLDSVGTEDGGASQIAEPEASHDASVEDIADTADGGAESDDAEPDAVASASESVSDEGDAGDDEAEPAAAADDSSADESDEAAGEETASADESGDEAAGTDAADAGSGAAGEAEAAGTAATDEAEGSADDEVDAESDADHEADDPVADEGSAKAARGRSKPSASRRRDGELSRTVVERYADLRERRTGRRWSPPEEPVAKAATGEAGGKPRKRAEARGPAPSREQDSSRSQSEPPSRSEGKSRGRGSSSRGKAPSGDARAPAGADADSSRPSGGPRKGSRTGGRQSSQGSVAGKVLERYGELREKRRRDGR